MPPADKPAIVALERPAAVVLDSREVSSVLGNEVRSAANEDMGRIATLFGSVPSYQYFETPVVVDNAAGQVLDAAE